MYSFFVPSRRVRIAALGVFLLTFNANTLAAPPLTISGTPPTSIVAGQNYGFQPVAQSKVRRALTFSISNQPSWASFNAYSGALNGTPQSAHVGTYSGIVISVSDGRKTASLPAFAIAVRAASSPAPSPPSNRAPTIAGTPSTQVIAASSYLFTPVASDPDGDPLTFSIQNKPAWAAFTASNGRLSGTPAAADVGTYSNVVISVSDGKASASLSAFSIAVTQVANGSATLSWTAPTENTDGSVLTNLAGYRICYGTDSTNLAQTVQVANPGVTTLVVENLSPGTWFFALKAYNSSGTESDLSALASKTIN